MSGNTGAPCDVGGSGASNDDDGGGDDDSGLPTRPLEDGGAGGGRELDRRRPWSWAKEDEG